jgi:hypothetical protein
VFIAAELAAAVGQLLPCVKTAPVPDEVFKLSAVPSALGAVKFPNGLAAPQPESPVAIADTITSDVPVKVALGALQLLEQLEDVVPAGTVSATAVVELGW